MISYTMQGGVLMKTKIRWKPIIFSILLCWGVGGLASLLTLDGLKAFPMLAQPPLTPPQIVFPVVWTILLTLLGIGFGLAVSAPNTDPIDKERVITSFSVQLTFFFCWMIWFFGLGWYLFAAVWLVGLIVTILWMMGAFRKISILAFRLQIPYLLWCCFALYLNIGVWWLNR